ncbi:unnamed protein product [Paramecium sonneborni]|uniref:Uncharacterized protein n=1 Tax=Paramecium sonneborni TaxID=65129 RepID=A0A8S1RXX3_9CILI|nr:unnamed protein product [Paramecium sonneborni]
MKLKRKRLNQNQKCNIQKSWQKEIVLDNKEDHQQGKQLIIFKNNRNMQQTYVKNYYKYEDENLHHPHNLNQTFHKHQAQQISHENIKLADRFMKQEPVLKLDDYSHSYKEKKRLVQRLQRYQQFQQYVNSIRNNLSLSNPDTTYYSSILSKKKDKMQLQPILKYYAIFIIGLKNKSIDITQLEKINYLINQEEESILKELQEKQQIQDDKNQTKIELPEIPQLKEESQIETIRQDEIVENEIQQQIDNEVKYQSDDIDQQ